jgi:hypothetical protein
MEHQMINDHQINLKPNMQASEQGHKMWFEIFNKDRKMWLH